MDGTELNPLWSLVEEWRDADARGEYLGGAGLCAAQLAALLKAWDERIQSHGKTDPDWQTRISKRILGVPGAQEASNATG